MIIGLSGVARSGKDTVADMLVKKRGYVKMSFADPIREALYTLNPNITVENMGVVSLSSAVDGMGWEILKTYSSDIRPLMQRMGTEVGREMFGEDFWVKQAMRKAVQHELVVFSDVRYPNEADAIRAMGGQIIRIERIGVNAVNGHASEHALGAYRFDEEIRNMGTLEDLNLSMEALLDLYI